MPRPSSTIDLYRPTERAGRLASSPTVPDSAYRPDEPAPNTAAELVVTIRLRLGTGQPDAEAGRLIALLEQLAYDSGVTAEPTVPIRDDPSTVTVFPAGRSVYRGVEEISLTRREFDLLLCLANSPRRVFTRAQLLADAWGTEYTGHRSVDVHVTRLRAKIGMEVPLVTTLRGVGYRLHPEARVVVVRDR
jgi:DNA-binding response OmpR family regulator